jgi:hypothetical protein
MSNDSPASILFNEQGNPVGVIFDGTVYRLQTQDIIVDGYGNGPVAVKPPSTPAVPSDPALVVAISPNNSFNITFAKPSTSTTSSVPASLTNVNLLPSNSNRLGATIYNESSSGLMYLKLGAVAATTDYTIRMLPFDYYEVPFGYTGQIDSLWSITGGFARIDELTP